MVFYFDCVFPTNRGRRLACIVLAFCFATITAIPCAAADDNASDKPSEAKRPNIIFLMADDQCTFSMGCYGTKSAKTPNLDQLAREGMVFERHYDTTPICMASRASVFTGLLEYRNGCNFDSGNLLSEHWANSYPQLLRKYGYQVAFAGKFGVTVTDTPGGKGRLPVDDFDRWGGGPGQTNYETRKNKSMSAYAKEYPHSTLSYGAFGQDFIRDASQSDKPFCLSISFKAPHQPVRPDPKFDSVYENVDIEKPANYGRSNGMHFSKQSRQGRQYERFDSWMYSSDYVGVMRKYFQQIYAIDVAVGMIRDALKESGCNENTVIIYTSDNGFMCGSHGYGSKVIPYEESSRVPLIVFDPRHHCRNKQQRCREVTGNVDFAPTILNLAGIEPPGDCDGRDLMALLDNPTEPIHRYLPIINVWGPRKVHSLAVVSAEGKYIFWPYGDTGFEPTFEFYHLKNDALELHNLNRQPEYQEVVQRGRVFYQEEIEKWKRLAVPYHGYARFAKIFDPDVSWKEKAKLYEKKK